MQLAFRVQLPNKRVRVVLYRPKSGAPFYARWNYAGQPYHRSTNAYSENAARSEARELVESEAIPIRTSGLTFAGAVKRYLAERWPASAWEANNRTALDHKSRLGLFVQTAGSFDIGSTSIEQAIHLVQKFIQARKEHGDSPVSQSNCQRVVSRFCTWLLKTRDERGRPLAPWRANPASKLNLVIDATDSVLKPHLSDDMIQALITAARGAEIWPCVICCLGAGLRPIEAARIEWSRVNLVTRKMIARGKGRDREILMSDWVHRELSALPREHAKLFRWNTARINLKMNLVRNGAGLDRAITLQACRRTACRKAAPHMTVEQYAHYFGHSISVAKRHYIGYGLMGADANVNKLNFDATPDKKPVGANHKKGAENDVSIYEQ